MNKYLSIVEAADKSGFHLVAWRDEEKGLLVATYNTKATADGARRDLWAVIERIARQQEVMF